MRSCVSDDTGAGSVINIVLCGDPIIEGGSPGSRVCDGGGALRGNTGLRRMRDEETVVSEWRTKYTSPAMNRTYWFRFNGPPN